MGQKVVERCAYSILSVVFSIFVTLKTNHKSSYEKVQVGE